jgi:high-affinity iron transporter
VILILMAAGMLAAGVGKLIALGLLPPLVEPIWDSSWLLDEGRLIGSLVAGLFGYRSSPSLMQFLAYLMYFPLVWLMLRRQHHDLAQ